MDTNRFDDFTQGVGAFLSRRRLLQKGAVVSAGLGLGVATMHQAAAKNGKHGKNKNNKKAKKVDANKLCKTQVAPCQDILTAVCADDGACLASVQICCPKVATCDFGGFLACLRATQV